MAMRASRSRGLAVAGALAVHAAMVLVVVLSVKITSPPREGHAVAIELVPPPQVPLAPTPRGRPRPVRPTPARPSFAPPPVASTRAVPFPAPTQPSTAPAAPEGQTALRNILRGSAGCADPDLYDLSPEERARCERLLQRHVNPDLQIPAPIDPAKRQWFDASLSARKAGKAMPVGPPGLGHAASIGGSCGPGGSGIKLGPLPCHIAVPPPGAFNNDDAPAP